MKQYLLDSNILIYYFNGDMEGVVKNKVSTLMLESFQISVISKMEFLGFPFNLQERQKAAQFMECAIAFPPCRALLGETCLLDPLLKV